MARRRRRKSSGSAAVLVIGVALALLAAWRNGAAESLPSSPSLPVVDAKHPRARNRSLLPESKPVSRVGVASEASTAAAFVSLESCEAYLRHRPRAVRKGPRVGSWNIRWFPKGTSQGNDASKRTDLPWLACAIAALDVDVLAVQEITQGVEGRGALLDLLERLDAHTGGRWGEAMDDCPGSGRQHVGFLFDTRRVEMSAIDMVAALNPGRSACDKNLRPGLRAHARFLTPSPQPKTDAWLISVHLDSGTEARDFTHRAEVLARLPSVTADLQRHKRDDDILVLGDFNNMGCLDCEGAAVTATEETSRIDNTLHQAGFTRIPLPPTHSCTHYYSGHAGLLDHILAPTAMTETRKATLQVHGACAAQDCQKLKRSRPQPSLQRLSDHCPITLQL